MSGPKSLLTVKQGLSFLDIIVNQVLYLRQVTGARLPLLRMNSFSTHDDTLAAARGLGSVDQFIDATDLLTHPDRCRRLRAVYL